MSASDKDSIWTKGEVGSDVVEACLRRLSDIFPELEDHQFMRRVAYVMSRDGEPSAHISLYNDGGIWQVSKYALEDTMDTKSHARLVAKHSIISEHLNITWTNVKRSDLAKPMISALAARLYISNFPDYIPPQPEHQAKYWWNKYMINHEAKCHMAEDNFLIGINELKKHPQPAPSGKHLQSPLDLMVCCL